MSSSESVSVEFANVLLLSAADSSLIKGQLSELDGSFVFESINAGSYILKASLIGSGINYSSIFTINGDEKIIIPTIKLVNGINIDEVSILAKKPLIELKADKLIVNVANSRISSGQTALEVLEKSPGVIMDYNKNLSLKGKQGVLVTINGKNQYLSGEELARMLENMPASNIQSVEIISNPSAKFDAEGSGGIINIVLKKNEKLGFNGNLSSTIRQGRKTSNFQNVDVNYGGSKLNAHASLEYVDNNSEKHMGLERNILFEGKNTNFNQETIQNRGRKSLSSKVVVDWTITPKTSFSFLSKIYSAKENETGNSTNFITGWNKPEFDQLLVTNDDNERDSNQNYNIHVVHKFNENGLELNMDSDYYIYSNNHSIYYNNKFVFNDNPELKESFLLRNIQRSGINIFASKIDLNIPINKDWKIDVGSKLSQVKSQNNTVFEFLNDNSEWENQISRSNDFLYNEQVLAFYINTTGTIAGFNVQAGLRMESTNTIGESITLERITPRSYTDLFPSVSVSKMFMDKHQFSLSYNRGLQRPNYQDLNPFEYFLDQFTFNRGNPLLNPQYSNTIGLNYAMGNALFVSLEYMNTTDAIIEVIEQDSEENKTFQTNQNLDNFNHLALSVSKPKVWTEWFTSRFNYTAYYTEFKSVIPSGYLENKGLAHFVNVNNEIQLPKDWSLELTTNVQSSIRYGLFIISPKGNVDIGLSKRLMNNRAKLNISVSDLFYTDNTDVVINQDDIDLQVIQRNDTRRVTVNFQYSFGNQKVQSTKQRTTASAEESGRL